MASSSERLICDSEDSPKLQVYQSIENLLLTKRIIAHVLGAQIGRYAEHGPELVLTRARASVSCPMEVDSVSSTPGPFHHLPLSGFQNAPSVLPPDVTHVPELRRRFIAEPTVSPAVPALASLHHFRGLATNVLTPQPMVYLRESIHFSAICSQATTVCPYTYT